MSKDLGDFQTPFPLVKNVLRYLVSLEKPWTRVLEPTCGQGNFIVGLLNSDMDLKEIQGIEVQEKYVEKVSSVVRAHGSVSVAIEHANIFDLNLHADIRWKDDGRLLVVGNPPWITNSELSIIQSSNIPTKTNFKKLLGFEAMTGASNFDIAEYIILKIIFELSSLQPTIAMLCKTVVARNVLQFAANAHLPVCNACIRKIDSKEHFGAMVDACLFCFDVGPEGCYQAEIYSDLDATEPESVMGIVGGRLVSDFNRGRNMIWLDGACPLVWRQGVKHDAASVAELTFDDSGQLVNRQGEIVNVEHEYVYPLLKSSNLGGKEKERSKKAVIITQRYIGEDTFQIKDNAPMLWSYLMKYQEVFAKRKSSIYKGCPPFSIFGVGDYSFAPYKIAISGMYKILKFSIVGPINDRPVMFDDTCYFVPCFSAKQASFILCLLDNPLCHDFLQSIVFWDAKRPITKKLLQRIDLIALLNRIDKQALLAQASLILAKLGWCIDEMWPDDLSIFLRPYSLGNQSKNVFQETRVTDDQVVQMGLFDMFI